MISDTIGCNASLVKQHAHNEQVDDSVAEDSPLPPSELEDKSVDEEDDQDSTDDEEETLYQDPPAGFVRLRPSRYAIFPSTIYFEYPPELRLARNDWNILESLQGRKLSFQTYWERVCIKNCFIRAGFSRNTKYFTAVWSKHLNAEQLSQLNCLQKVNHFPNSWCIGRKDRLAKLLQRFRRNFGTEYSFHPESFILPADRSAYDRAVDSDDSLWIVKPVASSCGRGIKVMAAHQVKSKLAKRSAKLKKVRKEEKSQLVQRYIANPMLINGRKFDLRLYVLVTSFEPLRVYIHREGLTRISTADYSLRAQDTRNNFIHLTNYSINKKNAAFTADVTQHDEFGGNKWSLSTFEKWLIGQKGNDITQNTMASIYDIVLKTMITAASEMQQSHSIVNYTGNCYELFGLDVLLTDTLEPTLIECNISPSLMSGSAIDRHIKSMLISDIFHVVGFYPYDEALLDSRNPNCRLCEIVPVSKMMTSQELYRGNPTVDNVDLTALSRTSLPWYEVLLLLEDEISRSRHSNFQLLYPTNFSVLHYDQFFENSSHFLNHLVAKWILGKGSVGDCKKYIPSDVRQRLITGSDVKTDQRLFDDCEAMKEFLCDKPAIVAWNKAMRQAKPTRPKSATAIVRATSAKKPPEFQISLSAKKASASKVYDEEDAFLERKNDVLLESINDVSTEPCLAKLKLCDDKGLDRNKSNQTASQCSTAVSAPPNTRSSANEDWLLQTLLDRQEAVLASNETYRSARIKLMEKYFLMQQQKNSGSSNKILQIALPKPKQELDAGDHVKLRSTSVPPISKIESKKMFSARKLGIAVEARRESTPLRLPTVSILPSPRCKSVQHSARKLWSEANSVQSPKPPSKKNSGIKHRSQAGALFL